MIYFIGTQTHVKIGYVGDPKRLEARLKALQTGNPQPLTLLATMPGNRSDELALHRRWNHLRTSGEWFKLTPELHTFIQHERREKMRVPWIAVAVMVAFWIIVIAIVTGWPR